jgi:hypothetical protein
MLDVCLHPTSTAIITNRSAHPVARARDYLAQGGPSLLSEIENFLTGSNPRKSLL